jgi:hypothetical protein
MIAAIGDVPVMDFRCAENKHYTKGLQQLSMINPFTRDLQLLFSVPFLQQVSGISVL